MTIKKYARNGKCKIKVEGEMTIYTSAEMMPKLLMSIDKYKETVVDLSHVSEIDTSGIQLLEFIKREAERDGKEYKLENHSGAVLDVFRLYHLTNQMDAAPGNTEYVDITTHGKLA